MVGGSTHQQQQEASQLAPPSSSTAPTTATEEEEFLKRNTDCVYFLASPLTCKKGSECEYRHSDIARVNPRDCWYWLNGNCLNPKCGFRHPPLDGLLGAEVPTPVGPSVPQAPVTPALYASPYATPKQGVSCIFFQKGFCLKGHLCPFLHGPPNAINNKAAQPGPLNPVTKPPQMASAGLEKSVQEQKLTQQENVQKPVEFLPPQGKQVPRVQAPAPARNGGAMEKKVPPPSEEPPRYRPASIVPPPVLNEFPTSRSNHGVYETRRISDNDGILNGKDADGYSREPTPGFDVLVDNELGDSEYYHNEDHFGGSSGHDFDIGRSTNYDVDRDMYSEQRDYDHYNERDRLHGERYAWEDRRASSERMLAGAARYPRDDSPDQFDEADLRHRISRQRRGNVSGLRSVVSREHARDSHADRKPRRDSHHHRLDLGSLSSRLRGRIKIPGRSTSPGSENDLRVEREIDIGRQHRSRYSPGRPLLTSSNHSRLRDRIKGRVSDDCNNEGKDYRGSRGHRDMGSDNDSEFTGPKRLLELKSGRAGEGYEQQTDDRQSLGKRKYPRVESRQSEDNLSFEGPKPLSEILKRKRGGAETTAIDTRISSVNNEDNNQKERKEVSAGSMVHANKEESESVSPEFVGAEKQTSSINAENDKSMDGRSSLNRDVNEPENEVGSVDEDALLDQELEAYDHRDGDYDYEQIDGEDYNLDEGENPDEECMEGDDGAKKESDVWS